MNLLAQNMLVIFVSVSMCACLCMYMCMLLLHVLLEDQCLVAGTPLSAMHQYSCDPESLHVSIS